jgi:GNAT superfamily N-acetyltransferase
MKNQYTIKVKINIRKATPKDVATIVQLLAQDELGKLRESYQIPLPEQYYRAFEEINRDKNNYLLVAEEGDTIIGTLQLTIIPYLTYQGGKRALIEGVRVNQSYRGQGIGKQMIEWAIQKSRELSCHLIQLTTDKKRPESLEFYKKIGFINSHEGLKLHF